MDDEALEILIPGFVEHWRNPLLGRHAHRILARSQGPHFQDGKRFFVGGWDNHFRGIDAGTGKVAWDLILGRKQNLPGFSAYAPSITHPCVGDGNVFVSTGDSPNGTGQTPGAWGNSVLEWGPGQTLKLTGVYSPWNYQTQDTIDSDLGGGRPS